MKKKKRFAMSQNAHLRLKRKHATMSNGYNSSFVKMNYHSLVHHKQKKVKRILSADERKKVYADVIKTFF